MVASVPETQVEKLKLLVPTDFSEKSELALDFALRFSRFQNAEIYLFHVLDTKPRDFRELDRMNTEHMERMREAVLHAIDRLAGRGITDVHVDSVHRRIAQGKPSFEILKMAGGISADMIIMGAPSSRSFKELLLKSPCTTVFVREKDPEFVITD